MELPRLPEEFASLPEEFPLAPEPADDPRREFDPPASTPAPPEKKHRLLRRLIAASASMLVVSAMLGLLPFDAGSKSPVPSSPDVTQEGEPSETPPEETTPPEEPTEPVEQLPEALQAIPEGTRVATCISLTVYDGEPMLFDSADLPAYGEEGQKLALQWAVSQGADLSRLVFDRSEQREDPLPEDVSQSVPVRADWYTLDIPLPDKENGEELPPDDGDDAFPPLPNLDPQRGNIQGIGSEFYIRFMDGAYENWKYLTAGSYWTDTANFSGPALDVNLMGNGFTIRLVGENRLEGLQVWGFMYGGSVTFTGSGSLVINGDGANPVGLVLNAEASMSCLMVDREVTLEIRGADAAVGIFDTLMPKSVYYLRPIRMNAGRGYQQDGDMAEEGFYNGAIFEEGSVEPAKTVRFSPAAD